MDSIIAIGTRLRYGVKCKEVRHTWRPTYLKLMKREHFSRPEIGEPSTRESSLRLDEHSDLVSVTVNRLAHRQRNLFWLNLQIYSLSQIYINQPVLEAARARRATDYYDDTMFIHRVTVVSEWA